MKIVCKTWFDPENIDKDDRPFPAIMVIDLYPETIRQIMEKIELFHRIEVSDSNNVIRELRFSYYGFKCYGRKKIDEFEDSPFPGFKILPEGTELDWTRARIALQEISLKSGSVIQFCCEQNNMPMSWIISPILRGVELLELET